MPQNPQPTAHHAAHTTNSPTRADPPPGCCVLLLCAAGRPCRRVYVLQNKINYNSNNKIHRSNSCGFLGWWRRLEGGVRRGGGFKSHRLELFRIKRRCGICGRFLHILIVITLHSITIPFRHSVHPSTHVHGTRRVVPTNAVVKKDLAESVHPPL